MAFGNVGVAQKDAGCKEPSRPANLLCGRKNYVGRMGSTANKENNYYTGVALIQFRVEAN
jgi:hypothetical protein